MAFTFHLDPKALWHDGLPVTAGDVVFTIGYFKKHPYRWVSLDNVGRAEATDRHTVVIHLAKPYAPFVSEIGGTMPVLPRHIWETVSEPKKYDDPKACIGSGPYLFRDFNKAQGTYLFEAFEDYYQGCPKAGRLIYVKTRKPLVSLLTGQVDLANIRPEMAAPLKKKGMVIIENERGWTKKLMINHRKFPFDQLAFRQALAYAIDRQELIDKSQRGFASPASYGLLTVDHEMYNPKTPAYAYNPSKAEALITACGYSKGPDGMFRKDGKPLHIELLASNLSVAGENVADRDGEIIKLQLQKVGMQVDLVNLEQATTDSRVKKWRFDLAVSGHGGLAGDPKVLSEMISPYYGASSVNSARYDANKELNHLMEAQMAEMDAGKRLDMVRRIQEIHATDLPAIPLYYPDTVAAYNSVKGITWFYTRGGLCKGVPIPQNKMSLIQ